MDRQILANYGDGPAAAAVRRLAEALAERIGWHT